ncbi:MAG TPA: ABC transporter permease [Chitinophagaceae bacterium]|jgi:predicted permease|nr:ABC transporter permease [Chitinophagaceae bacterium]
MIKNYFKVAVRNLWKNKTYSFLNVFGLCIGITCAGFIFLWVEDELNYNHQNKKINQLYQVMENQTYEGKTYTFSSTPGLLAQAIQEEIPGIKSVCRTTWDNYTLFGLGDRSFYERGYYADSSIFNMLTLSFVQGKKETAFNQLHSLVVSEKMAKKFFGDDKDIVGKTLKVDNKEEYLISGVMKDLPENSTFRFDWLAPFKIYFDKNNWLLFWGNNGIQTYVELDPKADVIGINKKLDGFIKAKDTTAIARPFLFSMNDWRLRNNFEEGKQVGGRIQFVRMFTTIAWIILLIACINFMNLATARSEKRSREVGVRKVLGAKKGVLIGQFIGEAIFMSFFSVIIAILLMYLLLPVFNTIVVKHLTIGLNKPQHIYSLASIALICGLVAGSYPALYLSSFNPISVFKGFNLKGTAPVYIRKGLVVLQFTISIILIIGTIIIYQQVQHIRTRDLGYDKENLLQTALRGDMQKNFSVIKNDLVASGYVKNVAMSNLNMLYMGSSTNDFKWEGKDPSKQILITQDYVSPEYLSTTGVTIKEGRDFYPGSKDSLGIIINEALAKMIGKDPVGKILHRDTAENKGIDYTIIGVAKNFVYGDMYGTPDPLVFMNYPDYFGYLYIRLNPAKNTEQAIAKIESIMKANNPGFPFNYSFVDEEFDKQFRSEILIGKLSRVFALLAIIISCLGLFGLAAYTAERKTREIGIRKVLGASVAGITGLLSRNFLLLVAISAIIAFPVAWWAMHKWLQDFAYRISISWWVFILSGLLALIIALITISFQSIRAAVANPVKSLRTE